MKFDRFCVMFWQGVVIRGACSGLNNREDNNALASHYGNRCCAIRIKACRGGFAAMQHQAWGKGRVGGRGVQTLQWELQGVFGIICASNSLGSEPAWKPAKGRPWFERAAPEPGLGGVWAMLNTCLSSKLILHLSCASSLNIIIFHGTAPLEKGLTTPPASARNLCRAMDMTAFAGHSMEALSCPLPWNNPLGFLPVANIKLISSQMPPFSQDAESKKNTHFPIPPFPCVWV